MQCGNVDKEIMYPCNQPCFSYEMWYIYDSHLLAENRQVITRSSLQTCFVIAHTSGDILMTYCDLNDIHML